MSIIEQRIDDTGVYIRFSGGAEFAKTKAQIRALFQAQGTKAKTFQSLKTELQQLLGTHLNASDIAIDFSPANGVPVKLEWSQG